MENDIRVNLLTESMVKETQNFLKWKVNKSTFRLDIFVEA